MKDGSATNGNLRNHARLKTQQKALRLPTYPSIYLHTQNLFYYKQYPIKQTTIILQSQFVLQLYYDPTAGTMKINNFFINKTELI